MSQLLKLYLFAFNSLQTFGWTKSLFKILTSFATTGFVDGAYASAGKLICLLQTCAFLEVVNGAMGLVPSGLLLPLMQWGGRTHFLLAIVRKINEVQEFHAVFITFSAWSLAETIRYLHYALNIFGSCPYWLTYLRYTSFIVLYPMGVSGEMWLMYRALPFIKRKNLYGDFFAGLGLPFSYYDFVTVVLIVYPFLWLKLYLHLFKQRRSKLGRHHEKKRR